MSDRKSLMKPFEIVIKNNDLAEEFQPETKQNHEFLSTELFSKNKLKHNPRTIKLKMEPLSISRYIKGATETEGSDHLRSLLEGNNKYFETEGLRNSMKNKRSKSIRSSCTCRII